MLKMSENGEINITPSTSIKKGLVNAYHLKKFNREELAGNLLKSEAVEALHTAGFLTGNMKVNRETGEWYLETLVKTEENISKTEFLILSKTESDLLIYDEKPKTDRGQQLLFFLDGVRAYQSVRAKRMDRKYQGILYIFKGTKEIFIYINT